MPTYEIPLLYRVMTQPELKSALKRSAQYIFATGGFIRKIDSLGKLKTPYKISSNGQVHREAHYFIWYCDVPPRSLPLLNDEHSRDIDIIRSRYYTPTKPSTEECTFHEEMLPPPYRPSVIQMLELGKMEKARKEKRKFKFNTGLDYYPFQT